MCRLRQEQCGASLPMFCASWHMGYHVSLKTRSSTVAGLCIFAPKGSPWLSLCFPGRPKAQGTTEASPGPNHDKRTSLEIFSVRLKKKTNNFNFLPRKGKCNEGGKRDRREELIRSKLQTRLDEYKLSLLQSFPSAAVPGLPFSYRRWLSRSLARRDADQHRETSRSEQPTTHCTNKYVFQRLPFERWWWICSCNHNLLRCHSPADHGDSRSWGSCFLLSHVKVHWDSEVV